MEILNLENISALNSQSIVTVGMFDGLHLGHRHLLSQMMRLSAERGLSPVVVTFDRHPRQVLHPDEPMSLLSTYNERMRLLDGCGVPTVVLVHFDRETALLGACDFTRQFLCNRLNMRMLLLGYDNMFGSRQVNDFDRLPQLAKELDFEIEHDEAVLLDGVEISSTKVRKALCAGDIATANRMLGANYCISGTVVHGRHVGGSLGFPTANVMLQDTCKLIPAEGVYALRAFVDGHEYAAMANIGPQPTFHSENPAIEVHLIDFKGDIYGNEIRLEFVARLRDIIAFENSENLVEQLNKDRQIVMGLFEIR